MKRERQLMFLCDQKRECHGSLCCGLACRHTSDIDHAKSERPLEGKFLRDCTDFNVWWEVDNDEPLIEKGDKK